MEHSQTNKTEITFDCTIENIVTLEQRDKGDYEVILTLRDPDGYILMWRCFLNAKAIYHVNQLMQDKEILSVNIGVKNS